MRTQKAPTTQRDRHRFEVARAHSITERAAVRLGIPSRTRLKVHAIAVVKIAAKRQLAGECGCRDPGKLAYSFQRLRKKMVCLIIIESTSSRLHLHREELRCGKPRINRE